MPRQGVCEYNATYKQKRLITQLCMALGIKEPVEEKPMSFGVAGELGRKLGYQVNATKCIHHVWRYPPDRESYIDCFFMNRPCPLQYGSKCHNFERKARKRKVVKG